MAANGTYKNPYDRDCWETCLACGRCDRRGTFAKCTNCSGRFDLHGKVDPHPDDYCDCRNGVLRVVTQKGQTIVTKYPGDPYAGQVKRVAKSTDERDWEAYLETQQEKFDDPTFDPIQVIQ